MHTFYTMNILIKGIDMTKHNYFENWNYLVVQVLEKFSTVLRKYFFWTKVFTNLKYFIIQKNINWLLIIEIKMAILKARSFVNTVDNI